ncbi:MAG: aldose 1-epimerase [Candidatus Limnocylindria bacterium]
MDRLTLGSETVEVEILPELGARLHRLRVFGHDLLRTPDDISAYDREPFFWGSVVMAPWCNRIQAGSVRFGAREIRLDPNFPDGTAIHGQVSCLPWNAQPDGALRVSGGGDGWPWEYEVTLGVEVHDLTLRLDHALTNLSADPMPAGIGAHPWFMRPALLRIQAEAVYPRNADSAPAPEPVAGSFDLRQQRAVPDDLDATWTELGVPPVELAWPTLGVSATMRVAADPLFIVAASPTPLDAIAVEPQSHAPQGLRRLMNHEPGAMAVLRPGDTLRLSVDLAFERLTDGKD